MSEQQQQRRGEVSSAGGARAEAWAAADAGEPLEVVARAAAVDVAKDSGMVCTRVPHETRAGRRDQKVWKVSATYDAVLALADHLICQGIERVVLESTSTYWRIWFYLLEARGLSVWLVNARDVKNVPGRPKTDKLDSVWLCKLCERGMLRASFVPPAPVRQLRDLTRLRAVLRADCARHKQRVEKILEDALVKVSTVVSDLFGASGRAMLAALVAGQRNPKALAALAKGPLRSKTGQLEQALKGRFTDHHGYQIGLLLELIEDLESRIAALTARIEAHIDTIEAAAPTCTGCGMIGGSHAPSCSRLGETVLSLVDRLDEVTGIGRRTAQGILAEVGVDMGVFPSPGHLGSWAKLTPKTMQSGATTKTGKAGKGNPWLRSALGEAVLAAGKTDTFLGARYRRIRKRRGTQKAIVATARAILEICWHLINDPNARFHDLGADYHDRAHPERLRNRKIRELERLTGMKVDLQPAA